MALDPTALPDFVTGTTVQASDIRDRLDTIQEFMNGQIGATELSATPWVEHEHVIRAEYYGSPSPRTIGTSFHAWHRLSIPEGGSTDQVLAQEDFSTNTFAQRTDQNFFAIKDASATIHVPPIDTGGTIGMSIWVNWFTRNRDGVLTGDSKLEQEIGSTGTNVAAAYQLFVDDTSYPETIRYSNAQTVVSASEVGRIHRKDMSTCLWVPSISAGTHSVALKMMVFQTRGALADRRWKNIFTGIRSFEVEIFLL